MNQNWHEVALLAVKKVVQDIRSMLKLTDDIINIDPAAFKLKDACNKAVVEATPNEY